MTFYVGVDIAKYEHVASVLDGSTGEFLIDSLHFDNNAKGFKLLLSNLCELNKKDVVIGFESTVHYHQTLFSYLSGKKYRCFLINPFMTSRFRSLSLRNAKNDNIDSRAIASFLSFEYRNLIEDDFFLNELKELSIQRDSLLKRSSSLKIQLLTYLDRVFPELESVVSKSGIHSKAVRAILKECPTAGDISSTRIDHLQKLAKDASNNRYSSAKVLAIKEAARTSVGFPSEALGLKIRQTIQMLEELKKQIDEVNLAICSSPTVIDSPLHKIKGISSIEIAYIMSAIININRFDSPDKLIAYAGLDPIVKQSGTWQAKNTRMSKRGNRLLRFALIWAANNVRKHPSKMKDYYGKKITEGKSHYNALGHCAAKLCRYIFFVLNHPNQDFIN
ncbi:MAG: IS110 family transposase [Solobacterium sp.]|nr:IS110 family transposase [Solobacterium sp.]